MPRSPRRVRKPVPHTASGDTAPGDAAKRRGDDITAIKVDTRKLDSLVDTVGELVIVQSLIQEDPLLASHVDQRLAATWRS